MGRAGPLGDAGLAAVAGRVLGEVGDGGERGVDVALGLAPEALCFLGGPPAKALAEIGVEDVHEERWPVPNS